MGGDRFRISARVEPTRVALVTAKLPAIEERHLNATLRDSGVRFAAVDLPEANDLTVGIMALVAQQ